MLTRLEVDGFKNLLGLAVDFGPYTCIAGANAVGKSNIFDVIHFLSLLADHTFMEAASSVRSAAGPSDPGSIFWQGSDGRSDTMTLAAEMIVPTEVEDDFGRAVHPTTSFLRYEIELRHINAGTLPRAGMIELVRESLTHITQRAAPARLPWPHSASDFRKKVVIGRRSGTAYISTSDDGIVNVHQDGGSRGQPRTSPANRAPRSVVSTTTTSDDPTILAARREMQQWRILALEPSAMRSPDAAAGPSLIGSDGSHLAAALQRITHEEPDAGSRIAAAASSLVDVREVAVDVDARRDLLTLMARIGRDPLLPARSLSDGTLRFIALCIIELDREFGGLVCMEEPENGIHPARIPAMVALLHDLSVDAREEPGLDNPLRQVIVNTHSPGFVSAHDIDDDLLLALPATIKHRGQRVETVRLHGLSGTWRAEHGVALSKAAISDYLTVRPGAQFRLDVSPESA